MVQNATVRPKKEAFVAKHVETQHGEDGSQVLIFAASNGLFDLVHIGANGRAKQQLVDIATEAQARATARGWLKGGAA